MDNRKIACLLAAGFLSATLAAGATSAFAGPRDVLVEGRQISPEMQRTVSYRDLNLAERVGQKTLKKRIFRTASRLCFDLNGQFLEGCTRGAVRSTDGQVELAIDRAKREYAGLSVGPPVVIGMVIGVQ